MAATNYTPIQLYYSITSTNTPLAANLANGELAINIADGKMFYKDSGGTVQVIATKATGTIGGSNTQVQYNSSGSLAGSSNLTFDGTTLTANALNLTTKLAIAYGGTNASATPTAGAVAYGTGSAYAFTAAGTSNQVLISNGAGAPTWANLSGIGVTTFSAGTTGFTPSSATSGAITLAGTLATTNGGTGLTSFTANGVVYASSTSALATGSALTFDGTNFANTAGLLQSGTNVRVGIGVNTGQLYFNNTDVGVWRGDANSVSAGAYLNLGGYSGIVFATSAAAIGSQTEGMRLTSTGLGIGTSSPATKLHVSGVGRFARSTDSSQYLNLTLETGNAVYNAVGTINHVWQNAGTEQMRLDTSGNLGIGTTSPGQKLGVSGAGPVGIRINDVNTNYWDILNDSNLTFSRGGTERMRLDASGNLGLGVTPSGWGSGYKAYQNLKSSWFSTSSRDANFGTNVYVDAVGYKYIDTAAASLYTQYQGAHSWYTAASGTAGDAISFTQAMTLAASGGLSIGTTTDAGAKNLLLDAGGKLAGNAPSGGTSSTIELYNASTGNMNLTAAYSAAAITFATGGTTERARIDSSGNLLVGTTSSFTTGNDNSGSGAQYIAQSSNAALWLKRAGGNGDIAVFVRGGITSPVGSISITTTDTTYNTSSDYRLKSFIGAVTGSGERIDALQPVEFDWKASGKRARGFFADKFQEVYPSSVTGEKDGVDADGNPVYQQMQASTSEVIADLVAEIQSLRKRLAAAGIA